MGKSVFICRVPTKRALDDAIRAIVTHNVAEVVELGQYSDEEFARLDPMRARFFSKMNAQLGQTDPLVSNICGAKTRYTRGDKIGMEGCLVKYKGELWLEVLNFGGGASTTEWLKSNFPDCGWIGSEGKPSRFMEAPMASDWCDFATLRNRHTELCS